MRCSSAGAPRNPVGYDKKLGAQLSMMTFRPPASGAAPRPRRPLQLRARRRHARAPLVFVGLPHDRGFISAVLFLSFSSSSSSSSGSRGGILLPTVVKALQSILMETSSAMYRLMVCSSDLLPAGYQSSTSVEEDHRSSGHPKLTGGAGG